MKRDLEKLTSRSYDVLVIGGGIHGAVAAWDAALRGLSVALIERGDFGSATSQNSLKIIHGGLRYLQDGNLARFRTMARERTIWMKIAPHLVHPLTCLTPTGYKRSRSRLALGFALTLNDLLSFDRNRLSDPQKYLPNGKIITQQELARFLPGYDVSRSTGAAVWHDAQVYNTERLLLEFVLSAVHAGAEAANYVEATQFLMQGSRITGAQVKDVHTGQVFDVHSRLVLNCTGAWMNGLLGKIPVDSGHATSVAMNITVDKIWSDFAGGLPSQPSDGRRSQILFFVPWHEVTMIGTWHIPWNDAPDQFKLTNAILQGFIDEINSTHPALRLTLDDILHVTWGFLPVNKQDVHKQQVMLTRDGVLIDHQQKDNIEGLISVLGVKYTTARFVAEKAINLVVDKLGITTKACQTHYMKVAGGQIDNFKLFLDQAHAKDSTLLDEETIDHLVYSYGSNYQDLIQITNEQPELVERIDPNLPVIEAEIVRAIRQEMTLTLLDLIQRRTALGAAGLPSIAGLGKCAQRLGSEMGWGIEQQEKEIESVIRAYPFKPLERVAQ